MFVDINESLGTQPAKTMESRHCRSKPPVEANRSLIINLLLLHSNALNKIKEHRACLVIYFLDLQPTVKIISKKTTSPLFSLSEFKLQNFWAGLSGNLAKERNGSQVLRNCTSPGGIISKHASLENRFLPFKNHLGASNPRPAVAQDGCECSATQIVNSLKTFFRSSVFVSVCVFNVWPKTTLLLVVWSRDATGWTPLLPPQLLCLAPQFSPHTSRSLRWTPSGGGPTWEF